MGSRRVVCVAALAVVCIGAPSAVLAEGERVATAVAVGNQPLIDGVLDDAAWIDAPVQSEFVQRRPDAGEPARDDTRFQVVYDSDALYIALRARQSVPVARHLARRDSEPPSDWIHVAIDGGADGRSALEFAVDAMGVQTDALWTGDHRDRAWDFDGWAAATTIDAHGWIAELRIPLAALRLPIAPRRIGLQVWRRVYLTGEESVWSASSIDDPRVVATFGRLDGMANLPRRQRLAIAGHLVLGVERVRSTQSGNLGLAADLAWAPRPDTLVNVAVAPDFGYVEADPAVVNLSAIELFVEERRPFFNEGRELFHLDLGDLKDQLVYTRRIGRPPQGTVAAAEGETTTSARITDVRAAAKITARPGDGIAIGVLDALTAPAYARVVSGDVVRQVVIEPPTHYAAARMTLGSEGGGHRAGALVTLVDRIGEEVPTLVRHAVAGAVDGSLRLGSQHQLDSVLLASWLTGSKDALDHLQRAPAHLFQRPDAVHLHLEERTEIAGYGGQLRAARTSGLPMRYGVDLGVRSPGLELGDLGFLGRADALRARGWGSHHLVAGRGAIEQLDTELSAQVATTFGTEVTSRTLNVVSSALLRSRWAINAGATYQAWALDPDVLRGGPALRTEPSGLVYVTVTTDDRRPVVAGMILRAAVDRQAAWALRGVPTLLVRPSSRLEVSAGLNLVAKALDSQFMSPSDDGDPIHTVVGHVDLVSGDLTVRAAYAFSRQLSLQCYGQLLLSEADFRDPLRVVAPRASDYGGRFEPAFGVADTDFAVQELHVVGALRWEARPDTTLSLLWSHDAAGRQPSADLDLWHSLDALRVAPVADVLMLKISSAFSR